MASAPPLWWACWDPTPQLEHLEVGVVGQKVGVDLSCDPAGTADALLS
jgi:uncharacterized phage infection (PIP) family protein YhgE